MTAAPGPDRTDQQLAAWRDAATGGGLPVPDRSRWQPLRAGVVNLWEFDVAEYWFADGRAQFVGANQSGKSTLMALTTLILLAGDLDRQYVDTFGQSDKSFRYYVEPTDDPRDRRDAGSSTNRGWAWVEYGRLADDGPEFFTALLYAQAKRGVKAMSPTWIVSRGAARVRAGIGLCDGQAVTPPSQLSGVPGLTVCDNGKQYAARLATDLFGFSGTERYATVLEMLKVLRTPHLGQRLNPSWFTEQMRSALPAVARSEIEELAEGWQQLEQLGRDRDSATEARKAISSYLSRAWRPWADTVLRRYADDLLGAHDAVSRAEQETTRATRELESARAELNGEARRTDELIAGARAAQVEFEGFLRSQAYLGAAEKTQHAQQLRGEAEAARSRAGESRQRAGRARDDRNRKAGLRDAGEKNVTVARDAVEAAAARVTTEARAAGLGLGSGSGSGSGSGLGSGSGSGSGYDSGSGSGLGDAASGWAATGDTDRLDAAVAARRTHIPQLRQLLRAAARGTLEQQAAEQSSADADAAHRERRRTAEKAAAKLETTLQQVSDDLERWAAGLGPAAPTTTLRDQWIEAVTAQAAQPRPRAILRNRLRTDWLDPALTTPTEQLATLRARAATLTATAKAADRDADKLSRADETPAPTAPPGWTRRTRPPYPDISGAPFWRLVDPAPGVAGSDLDHLEAALAATGLLDAWVTPDSTWTPTRDTTDTVITLGPPPPAETGTVITLGAPPPPLPAETGTVITLGAPPTPPPAETGTHPPALQALSPSTDISDLSGRVEAAGSAGQSLAAVLQPAEDAGALTPAIERILAAVAYSPAGHEPVSHEPASHEPAGHRPAGQQPAGHQSASHRPASHELAGQQPAGHEPAGHEPAGHQPASNQPGDHQPGDHQPANHQLGSHRPGHQVVVSGDGWWTNGFATGKAEAAPHGAELLGVAARAAARRRAVAELRERAAAAREEVAALEEQQAGLHARVAELRAAAEKAPDDGDVVTDAVAAASADSERQRAEASYRAAERRQKESAATADRALSRMNAFAGEHGLPADEERLDELGAALDRADRATGDLRLALNRFESARESHAAAAENAELAEEALAEAEGEHSAAEQAAAEAALLAEQAAASIARDDRDQLDHADELERRRDELGRARDASQARGRTLSEQAALAGSRLEQMRERQAAAVRRREEALAGWWVPVDAGLAEARGIDPHQTFHGTGEARELEAGLAMARLAQQSLRPPQWPETPEGRAKRAEAALSKALGTPLTELRALLESSGGRTVTTISPDQGGGLTAVVVVVDASGSQLGPVEAIAHLDELVEELNRSHDAAMDQIFTELLSSTFVDHLRDRLRSVVQLLDLVNDVLGRHATGANRTTLRLRRHPAEGQRAGYHILAALERRSVESDNVQQQIRTFLAERIREAQDAGAGSTEEWKDHLETLLDYRRWFDVVTEYRVAGGEFKPLTKQDHSVDSGGGKVVTLLQPLLATLIALYQESPDSPRPLWLDEAFEGVDPANRATMLQLLVSFDLDFLLAGPGQLVAAAQVPAAAVWFISRAPSPAPGVDLSLMLWAGRTLEAVAVPDMVAAVVQPRHDPDAAPDLFAALQAPPEAPAPEAATQEEARPETAPQETAPQETSAQETSAQETAAQETAPPDRAVRGSTAP